MRAAPSKRVDAAFDLLFGSESAAAECAARFLLLTNPRRTQSAARQRGAA
jgi:hypothetical protein